MYLAFFAVSTVLLIIGAAVDGANDSDSRRGLWSISVFVELPMYFVAEELAKSKATKELFGSKAQRDVLELSVPVEREFSGQTKPTVSDEPLSIHRTLPHAPLSAHKSLICTGHI